MKKILFFILSLFLFTSCSEKEPTESKSYERIASDFYIGELLALDIKPVAVNKFIYSEMNPFWEDYLDGVEDFAGNVEMLIELDPDLIITIFPDKEKEYSKIAKTVVIPYGEYSPKDLLLEIGKITNTTEKANKWIENFDKQVDIFKEELLPYINDDSTFSIVKVLDNKIFVYGENWGHGGIILYNELNLNPPEKAKTEILNKKDSYLEISLELLDEYLGNHIFLVTDRENSHSALLDNQLWKNLDAVKNNQVYEIPSDLYFNSDPISLDYQLKDIVSIIKK